MKLTKKILQQAIREAIEEQPPEAAPQSTRQKKVTSATTGGATIAPEEYMGMLKQVLLTPKVNAQVRKAALESLFGQRGSAINSLVLQMLKGEQQ
tara:strand:+ start:1071 stop:1355 length:285 start_codon:yes stop_codon:yes gene_type:complete